MPQLCPFSGGGLNEEKTDIYYSNFIIGRVLVSERLRRRRIADREYGRDYDARDFVLSRRRVRLQ